MSFCFLRVEFWNGLKLIFCPDILKVIVTQYGMLLSATCIKILEFRKRVVSKNFYFCNRARSFRIRIISHLDFQRFQAFEISPSTLRLSWWAPKCCQWCVGVQNSGWTPSSWVYRLTRSLGYLKYLHHSVPNPSRAFNQLKLAATLRLPGAVSGAEYLTSANKNSTTSIMESVKG